MMSNRNKQQVSYRLWGSGVVLLVLVMALWVWPTYINSPDSTNVGSVSELTADGHINVDEAFQMRDDGALMLDVRTQEEWDAGYIPGATLIPLDQLNARYGELPTDQEIVIYCRSGNRSAQALDISAAAGFSTTYTVDGGINDGITKGYEIVVGE